MKTDCNVCDDANLERRMLGSTLAFEVAKSMICGGLWVMSPQSVMGRIAQQSTYPEVMGVTWALVGLLVLPYLALQLFGIAEKYRSRFTKLACRAILASGVMWVYLGYLSKNLDYQYTTIIFLFNGLTCIATATILAKSTNNAARLAKNAAKNAKAAP